jgi:hypothetical protein
MASATRNAALGTYSFNPYAAGAKHYGVKTSPNIGPVDKMGYAARDRKLAARKAAVSKVMNAKVGK